MCISSRNNPTCLTINGGRFLLIEKWGQIYFSGKGADLLPSLRNQAQATTAPESSEANPEPGDPN